MSHLPAHERLPSGVTGLDRVLNGGFLKKRIYLIMGPPGAGKTILSNQICFHHVANGGRALYLTLLTETSSRMLADLQSFSFFSLAPVSDTLSYVSGYATLKKDGLDGLLNLLRTEVRRLHATLVVIDGAIIAAYVASSALDWMQFLHSLQALTELLGCTAFLLTPIDEKYLSQGEQTLVEGVLELTTRSADMRSVRELQVIKFRGSSFLEGRHLYTINDSGLVVYPRSEVISALSPTDLPPPLASSSQTERFSVGIAQLDTMLHGGLPSGSTTLVLGAPGTGKTLLGSYFLLDGAAHDQKGLYYSFYETPAQLIRKLSLFDLDLARFVTDGQVELLWQSPVQDHLDLLAEHILTAIQRSGAQRLFLDGLSGFRRSVSSPERVDLFLTAFFTALRGYGITTICSVELPDLFSPQLDLPASIGSITALAENIVLLRYVELHSQLYRLISIMKMRESDYDPSIREFRISSSQGIEIASTFSSAEAILTGVARVRSDPLNTSNSSAVDVNIDPSLGGQV
jgi:circadian clock protein KaiC